MVKQRTKLSLIQLAGQEAKINIGLNLVIRSLKGGV